MVLYIGIVGMIVAVVLSIVRFFIGDVAILNSKYATIFIIKLYGISIGSLFIVIKNSKTA